MTQELAAYGYLISAICFIMALRGLSSPETARGGNLYGIVGMVIAIGVTVATPGVPTPVAQPEAPTEPKRAKKPAPRAGAKRGGPARPRAAAPKKDGPAPKTTVKKAKKLEKPEGEKKE